MGAWVKTDLEGSRRLRGVAVSLRDSPRVVTQDSCIAGIAYGSTGISAKAVLPTKYLLLLPPWRGRHTFLCPELLISLPLPAYDVFILREWCLCKS